MPLSAEEGKKAGKSGRNPQGKGPKHLRTEKLQLKHGRKILLVTSKRNFRGNRQHCRYPGGGLCASQNQKLESKEGGKIETISGIFVTGQGEKGLVLSRKRNAGVGVPASKSMKGGEVP